MELKEYIAKIGDQEAAKLFRVKRRTTQSWRLGTRVPRPSQARRIIEVTKRLVTWEDIYPG